MPICRMSDFMSAPALRVLPVPLTVLLCVAPGALTFTFAHR